MVEPEDFHRDFLPRFIEAQRAFHNRDAEPNIALWSTTDPVTLFAVRRMCERGRRAQHDLPAGGQVVLKPHRVRMGAAGVGHLRRHGLHRVSRALHRHSCRWAGDDGLSEPSRVPP